MMRSLKKMLWDRSWRPEGGEWEPIKISSEIDPSAYIPKSPQALEPRSARIAMDQLSRSRRPRLQRGSKASETSQIAAQHTQTGLTGVLDRFDRSSWEFQTADRLHRPVRPVAQTGQTGLSQSARQQISKGQISSKRSPNPTKLGGKLRNYPVNISPKDLTQKIHGSRGIEERSKRIGVFSRIQNLNS